MDTELEAKFVKIDPEGIRTKLKSLGARLYYKEKLMKRKIYKHSTEYDNDWFRVRDEGNRITLSYKKLTDRSLYGTKEIMFTVPDFDQACLFLESAHLKFVAYQETKREMWHWGSIEITIDTWPWIPTLLEIEGQNEGEIKDMALKLGLDWKDVLHGSVENVYAQNYDVTEEEVCDWPEITFTDVPEWLKKKRKN
jgi:adenylate cyclase, class 2